MTWPELSLKEGSDLLIKDVPRHRYIVDIEFKVSEGLREGLRCLLRCEYGAPFVVEDLHSLAILIAILGDKGH